MSDFEDSEKAASGGFAPSDDFELRAASQRNRMLAMWAGEKMGLEADGLEAYARALTGTESAPTAEEDVVRRVIGDLTASNIAVRESEVATRAAEFLAQAREGLKA